MRLLNRNLFIEFHIVNICVCVFDVNWNITISMHYFNIDLPNIGIESRMCHFGDNQCHILSSFSRKIYRHGIWTKENFIHWKLQVGREIKEHPSLLVYNNQLCEKEREVKQMK